MKNITSTKEGVWKQINTPDFIQENQSIIRQLQEEINDKYTQIKSSEITKEQQVLLAGEYKELVAQQELLCGNINPGQTTPEPSDLAIAENCYLTNKPTIEEGQTYELIAVNVVITDGIGSGIINCRINDEHKQIRF